MAIEDPTDELFAVTPDEFVAARDALAKRLKADGDKEGAAAVKKLRKPSLAVWAVNALARERPNVVEELIAVADRVDAAQRELVGGSDPAEMREASRALRGAVSDATGNAVSLVLNAGKAASEATVNRISSTLQAAATMAEHRDALTRGVMDQELDPAGFGGLEGLELPADRPSRADEAAARRAEELAEEATAAEERAGRLAAQADDAERTARAARQRADAAAEEAKELRARADGAAKEAKS